MQSRGGCPGTLQLADALTKDKAEGADALCAVINSGTYRIGSEAEFLERRAEEKKRRLARGKQRAADNVNAQVPSVTTTVPSSDD